MAAYDDRDYAHEIRGTTSIDHSYESLTDAILTDFRNGATLDDILRKYTPVESVTSLILKEFPLLGTEDDKDILKLYQDSGIIALKGTLIEDVRRLLKECQVTDKDITDFIQNKDGMGLFQEFSIVNRRAVAEKSFAVDYKRIITDIQSGKKGDIVIDTSNRDFEFEIDTLKAKGIIRDDIIDTTRTDLIDLTMPNMQALFKTIKDKFSKGIGDIRHPMNDFQPTFVQRYEEHLADITDGVFLNLPELFLSFLPNSPVVTQLTPLHMVKPLSIKMIPYKGHDRRAITGSLGNITLTIIGIQNETIGITSLLENGLFFKLRTCDSIVASQVRGMHRYVPLQLDPGIAPLPLKEKGRAAEDKPKAKDKKGGAKSTDARPFFDLYQGQLLKTNVSNQELTEVRPESIPVHVSNKEIANEKLEMEHIIGVYQAALLFKKECYPMTIFANLQMMSHDSNNGVASKPYIPQKLDFMLTHPTVHDATSERTLQPRLKYFLARLQAMEDCLTDVATMAQRYLPYSSYKPGLDKLILFLTHGKAFEIVEASRFAKFEDMQHKTRKLVKTFQSISHDLVEMYVHGQNPDRTNVLFRGIIDKLMSLKGKNIPPMIEADLKRIQGPLGENPLATYESFVEKYKKLNKIIDKLYDGHVQNIVSCLRFLAASTGMDIREVIEIPLEQLLEKEGIDPSAAMLVNSVMLTSLKAMKANQRPMDIYRGVLFTLLDIDPTESTVELDRLGATFFDPTFARIMKENGEEEEDEYDEESPPKLEPLERPGAALERPGALERPKLPDEPVRPFTMGSIGRLPVVDDSVLQRVKSASKTHTLVERGLQHKLLVDIIYTSTVPFSNIEEILTYFDQDYHEEINEKNDENIRAQEALIAEQEADDARHPDDPEHSTFVQRFLNGEVEYEGGGKYISYNKEDCYIYDEVERAFDETGDQDAYDYLCNSWKLVIVEKEKKIQPFMTREMKVLILKKILSLIRDGNKDELNEMYLTHYDRDDPELNSMLRLIYDYFTSQGIYLPMKRDERPLYSLEELLVECFRKKMKFMSAGGDEMSFDNAYANILCIQIFGFPLTILINDLSNGKLPIPYGIQNHLCHDPFYPETFTITFNVLKCLALALPNCVSLITYLSYLNLLVGESFLHNLYTDSSFSIINRIHSSFFYKMHEMKMDRLGEEKHYLDASKLPNLFTPHVPGVEAEDPDIPGLDTEERLSDPSSVTSTDLFDLSKLGGTRRNRRYKQKTKRNKTLSKRFKKNRTRRLHGLYVRN